MVEWKYGTVFLGLRVLCCCFLSALLWVPSATAHGSPAEPFGTTQNLNIIVQYTPKSVIQYAADVNPDWSKNPDCSLSISISGENGTQHFSKPLSLHDCRIIYDEQLENKCFSDKPTAPITTNIYGITYHLVNQFQKIETQIRLWSESPKNGSKIDLVTRTMGEKTEYLRTLLISVYYIEPVWSMEPVFSSTIAMRDYIGDNGDYVAQTSDTDHWIELYKAARENKNAPNVTYLRSLVTETTEQIEGKLYYLVRQNQDYEYQFQLWSRSSVDTADGRQVVDLVRRRAGTKTWYLKNITITSFQFVIPNWVPAPPSFISIVVQTPSGVKYIAETRNTTKEPHFYEKIVFFRVPDAYVSQGVTQVTTKILEKTYYLLDQIEGPSKTCIQLWSRSPADFETGAQVHLVTEKGKTFTRYWKNLSVSDDGVITRAWSTSPSASTVFRFIDQSGTVSVAAPNSTTVIRYFS